MAQTSILVIATLLWAATASAQNGPPALPTPDPELKKLDYFVGTWKSESIMHQPGADGVGIHMSGVDHVRWMPGHFFLIIDSTETSKLFHASATGYMGYSPDDKRYTMDVFNSFGEAEHAKGAADTNTWTFTNRDAEATHAARDRYTITILSPTKYSYKFELQGKDSEPFTTIAEGTKTKVTSIPSPKP